MSRDDIMYNHLASVEELRWYILDNDDGTYTFRNAKTKKNLDLAVCSKDYGVGLKLQSSKICGYGSSSSKWRIELATPYVQNNFSKSRVIIKNVHSGLVANIDGNMNYAPVSITALKRFKLTNHCKSRIPLINYDSLSRILIR